MDDLGLKPTEAMLYKMIMQKGFITWTWEYMGKVLRISRSSVYRILQRMIDNELIVARTVAVQDGGGKRERVVYVALYTVEGERSQAEVNNLLKQGIEKLKAMYAERRYYKRK